MTVVHVLGAILGLLGICVALLAAFNLYIHLRD